VSGHVTGLDCYAYAGMFEGFSIFLGNADVDEMRMRCGGYDLWKDVIWGCRHSHFIVGYGLICSLCP
jgi:hypothetical protein